MGWGEMIVNSHFIYDEWEWLNILIKKGQRVSIPFIERIYHSFAIAQNHFNVKADIISEVSEKNLFRVGDLSSSKAGW